MGMTRLYFTAYVEEQWRTLAGPWLRKMAATAWKDTRPTVILTPSRAEGFYLKGRLLEEKASFLGLRFWTPSDARNYLAEELAPEVRGGTQAELRLIARVCAERLLHEAESITGPASTRGTWTSVAKEPAAFLRAYELLQSAGWQPKQACAAYGRAVAEKFETELEIHGITTQSGLHQDLLRLALRRKEPLVANLLLVGFNAAHWPLWHLLQAMVATSRESVIALTHPHYFAEKIDQLWQSSWEEATGTETVASPINVEESESGPFAELASSYAKGETVQLTADVEFLVTPELTSQIRVVVLRVLSYLQDDSCTRLGLVFPETDALALGVAEELQRLGIPIDDGTGALMPGLFEQRCWQAWLALQEEPGVSPLIAWVRACEAQDISFGAGEVTAGEVADLLDAALGESLVDQLEFLARQLEEKDKGNRAGRVADFLHKRVVLPETATFDKFLALTREALALPGWEQYLARLQMEPPGWLQKAKWKLSRQAFLEWLKETTDSQRLLRGAEGNHYYGKVHLLIYGQATGQTWSHLILTGLNEGVWPRLYETGAFDSRYELAALNQQTRAVNRANIGQGKQGEGHEVVSAKYGHCLLPIERQDLALRDLCSLLEGTSVAVTMAALTTQGGRGLLPSDFFNHAYQAKTGQVLNETAFQELARSTVRWCRKHDSLFQSPTSSLDITATRFAHEARRDATQRFGPYEFAFAQPPAQPIQLSCKTWETAWNHPSTVWLEQIVGAASWPEGTLSWSRAIGTWVHRWLAASLRTCGERNSATDFLPLLREAADREKQQVQEWALATGMKLYPWWGQVWGEAWAIALNLGETLAPLLSERHWLTELRLPSDLMIALPGIEQADFVLKGRLDLLLFEPGSKIGAAQTDFSGCSCWVIDFKTGAAQGLSAKRLEEGMGLQPVLYALAVRKMGATSMAISLHTCDAPLKQQVQLEGVLEKTTIFRSLDMLHRDGIFGMRADADNAYGYSPAYPMATRFVPGDILEAKWALVHGGDTASEEVE